MAVHLRAVVLPEGDQGDVFVVDGRVTFDEVEDAETVLDGGYLIPGLVDAHAHLAMASPAGGEASPDERARASALVQLEAAVLAIREPGSPDYSSMGVGPDEGLPRTVTGGRFLSPPHGYIPGLAREVTEEELPAAAVEEAGRSGAWAKIIGDFLGREGQLAAHWGPEVLAEAARRVHDVGARIAIHATLPEVIEAAIEAGFDAIEHGTMLQPEHIPVMAASSIALIPTLLIKNEVLGMMAGMGVPDSEVEGIRKAFGQLPGLVRQAAEAGVTVLAGTDAGMVPHGRIRSEISQLLAAGLTPESTLGAASWTARTYLGLPGIEQDAPADLVGYRDDPRQDPDALKQPAIVILDGKRIA